MDSTYSVCSVCFRHCHLKEGQRGFCKARINKGGKITADNYGYLTSLALDPMEKKPLKMFFPGSSVLSVGSYGCNLSCPFCQNYEISQYELKALCRYYSPKDLVKEALELKKQGRNIGLAYTYNEPLVGYEYVRDCAKLAHQKGLVNVLVTNGCFSLDVLDEIIPYIDAMNIDLKGFNEHYFHYIGSSLAMTEEFIKEAVKKVHVELTTLIVPSHNDDLSDFRNECSWISSLSKDIPLHITRYFPRYKERENMTPFKTMEEMRKIAETYLHYVFLGNI